MPKYFFTHTENVSHYRLGDSFKFQTSAAYCKENMIQASNVKLSSYPVKKIRKIYWKNYVNKIFFDRKIF